MEVITTTAITTRLMAFFRDNLSEPVLERETVLDYKVTKRNFKPRCHEH